MLNRKQLKSKRADANAKLVEALSVGKSEIKQLKANFAKVQDLVSTAVDETRAAAIEFTNTVANTMNRDEGILFIDYRGIVLHANQIAHKVLNCSAERLIGKPVEQLLSDKANKRSVLNCSLAMFEKLYMKKLTLAQVAATCKNFNFTTVSDVEVVLNEPIVLPYGTKTLTIRLTLLDTTPNALEDITYLCKLTH